MCLDKARAFMVFYARMFVWYVLSNLRLGGVFREEIWQSCLG